jgi:hypothetical protein
MPDSYEDSFYLAKLAEQAERYEGLIFINTLFTILHQPLNTFLRDG